MSLILNLMIFFLAGTLTMYLCYKPALDKYWQTLQPTVTALPLPYVLLLFIIGSGCAYFAVGSKDFIQPLTWGRMTLPCIAAAFIYIVSLLSEGWPYRIFVIAAVSMSVFLQPLGTDLQTADIPSWCIRLLLIGAASVFCLGARILNFLPHTFAIPDIITLLGLGIFALLGAVPQLIGLSAVLLAGILTAYLLLNFYEIKIDFDSGAATAINYLIITLILMNSGEFSFAACAILTVGFWAEIIGALWYKYILRNGGYLSENTAMFTAAQRQSAQLLSVNIFKIGAISTLIACFQLYAQNAYSLFIVALAIVIWLSEALRKPTAQARKLKDINREFIQELKQNIEETKNLFNKKDK